MLGGAIAFVAGAALLALPGTYANPLDTVTVRRDTTSTDNATDSCFSLENSTACAPWSSSYVSVSYDFANVGEFDDYIYNLTNSSGITAFRDENYCSTWDGHTKRRYYTSLICAVIVDVSKSNGCKSNSKSLCKDTVETAYSSVEELFNSTACKTTHSESDRAFNANIMQVYYNKTHPTSNCVLSTVDDYGRCGFIDDATAYQFCQSQNETCCDAVRAKAQGLPFTVPSTDSSNHKTAIICGVVFGILGLILVIALITFCCRRRRRSQDTAANGSFKAPYNMQHQTMYDMKQPNYSSNASPTNVAAARAGTDAVNNAYETGQVTSSFSTDNPEIRSALYNYVPNLSDEIYLYTGDEIHIYKRFDDGWGYGKNQTTFQTGTFPIACVENGPEQNNRNSSGSNQSNRSNRFSVRASSIAYNPSQRHQIVSYADTLNQ